MNRRTVHAIRVQLQGIVCIATHRLATVLGEDLSPLSDLTPDPVANDPRVGMLKIVFEFLLQQHYFCAAATMVAEHLRQIQRIEAAESSGRLSSASVKTASVIWQNEVQGFKYWFGANDDVKIAQLLQECSDKGMQKFIEDLAIELRTTPPIGLTAANYKTS